MAADDDLDTYAAARAPVLQEVLLRLDCPRFLVPGVVREAIGRCRRGWARSIREDDVDVVFLGTLLATWEDRRRSTGWQSRVGEVLTEVAGLDEWQVADVLDDLVTHRRRRPATRFLAALLVVVLVAAAAAVVWTARDEDSYDVLPPVPVQRAPALVDAVWYANGVLRLRDVVVVLGAVRALAAVGGGAVYVAGDGAVVQVDDAGRRLRLGWADPRSPVVASSGGRLVAWREEDGGLVLHDLDAGGEVGRTAGSGLEPVAIDGGRLFFTDRAGTAAFSPGRDPVRVSGLPLLDIRAGARLYQSGDGRVRLQGPGGRPSYVGDGQGGMLSPDGRFALVDSVVGQPVVLDLLGGTAATGLRPGERDVAATLVRDGRVVLVVAVPERAADDEEFGRRSASGSWELRTCTLGTGACVVESQLSAAGEVPLFAR
ncbi:hypothetical protein [Nocardioides sp. W7]|uniref:hypothetical protein n=1 Tax=Nocardioides sp. W7 TaxID=2931390 RepID=UPI001FD3E9B1|nr:hypothetical protein [Nocardioides sp. W7]